MSQVEDSPPLDKYVLLGVIHASCATSGDSRMGEQLRLFVKNQVGPEPTQRIFKALQTSQNSDLYFYIRSSMAAFDNPLALIALVVLVLAIVAIGR
jgi:hypothetical protein